MLNGYIERFDGRMRDEFLDETLFTDLAHVPQVMQTSGFQLQHREVPGARRRLTQHNPLQPSTALCMMKAPRAGRLVTRRRRDFGRNSNGAWVRSSQTMI
jgi:integrase-like protein